MEVLSYSVQPSNRHHRSHRQQKTVNRDLDNVEIEIHGRHDPMIVPRAVVVVESMAAVTILDGVLKNLGATMDNIKKIYGE